MKPHDTLSVLAELRPALDGHFGIPQETRLLFSALASIEDIELSGMLQMSVRPTLGGVAALGSLPLAERVHRYAQTVISLKGLAAADWKQGVSQWLGLQSLRWRLRLAAWFGWGHLPLRHLETRYFEDYVWQALFARSVPPEERERVLRCNHRICPAPWRFQHLVGLERRWLLRRSAYPYLDTRGLAVFIAQTPYPGRVHRDTALVVHYHDAIPILMPHTISDRAFHEASHFQALAANVRSGAWFVCVSDTTRQDLLRLFPEAEERTVTIHNMLPSHYFPAPWEPRRLAGIVQRYEYGEYTDPKAKKKVRSYQLGRRLSGHEKSGFLRECFNDQPRYVLMVSTIEPRKNHLRMLEAWEAFRAREGDDLRLVLVGHIGWDYQSMLEACERWVELGALFLLHSVPADALRILYRHALVTVCPSIGEGFDFSGAEAMRCGGVVVASDIPVHREVYGAAAEYFDPYDTATLRDALHHLILAPDADERREQLRVAGADQSARYLPECIVPEWQTLLRRVATT